MPFAENTSVSVEKSRAEIEALLQKVGASEFVSGWDEGRARIGFRAHGRLVKFELPFPDRADPDFWQIRRANRHGGTLIIGRRTPAAAAEKWEQENRRRWRALALVIKAKLEAVETGITTFEEEFLAHILLPNQQTVGQWLEPQIERAYQSKTMPPLMLGAGS